MTFIADKDYQKIIKQIPVVCVDTLILHKGKCLLLLRDNEPAKNTYWFPGGRIKKNELIKDAAIRKAKEETNIICEFERIISVEESLFKKNDNMIADVHTINICCLMKPAILFSLRLDHLHTVAKWISEIDPVLHSAVINPLKQIGFN